MGNLCWTCHKIGQGHPGVMIYTNFVELLSLMLHAKFQNHRPSAWFWRRKFLKVFAIYSHGGHLGHVTLTIYINFHSPFLRMLHMMFGLIGQAVSEKIFEYYGNIHLYCPGVGADHPLRSIFVSNHKSSVHLPISIEFFLSNDILTIFPIQMHG